jgi:hypothetical protein
MAYQVLERSSRYSAGWFPARGLENCSDDTRDQAEATIAEVNRKTGWSRFMVISKGTPADLGFQPWATPPDVNFPPCGTDA